MSLLLLSLIVGQDVIAGRAQAAPTGEIDVAYDRRREVKFSGTVTGKVKGTAPGKSQGMSILVKSGKTVRTVDVGPAWFVGRQEASVNMGDKVTIMGMPITIDRRQHIVLARQIIRGKKVLALRDLSGNPYWSVRRTRVARQRNDSDADMANMGTAYTGTVGEMQTFNVNGVQFSGYTVQTQNGPMNVAVAPSWYWNNQPNLFAPGAQVTFYGGQPDRVNGSGLGSSNGIILANSGVYNGGSFVLRPNGVPIYGGFR